MTIAISMLLAGLAPQTAATISLGEVAPVEDPAAMLALARRVLPADVGARLASARVQRVFLPGQIWWIGGVEPARVTGPDMCERRGHGVQLSAPSAPGGPAPADTVLAVGVPETWTEVAVVPAGTTATSAACASQSFVRGGDQVDRKVAAYRVLRTMMAAARSNAPLPFTVFCRSEYPVACQDARAALADLPMTALGAINVVCLDAQRIYEGNTIRCPPPGRGQPYKAEVRFGPSGTDGQSWTVEFVHRPGWPETIGLRRTTIIYH